MRGSHNGTRRDQAASDRFRCGGECGGASSGGHVGGGEGGRGLVGPIRATGNGVIAQVAAGARRALADARPAVFWSDRTDAPALRPRLTGATEADLVIIGGGVSRPWAALFATP